MKSKKITTDQLIKKIQSTDVAKLEKRFEFKGSKKPRYYECYGPEEGPRFCE